MKHSLYHSLGFKLLIYILLFSSLVTLVFTALQIFLEYQSDRRELEFNLHHIETSHLETLVNSLWIDDHEQVMKHLESISHLPGIQYLDITKNDKIIAVYGSPVKNDFIERNYPLYFSYNDKQYFLGNLKAVVTLQIVHQRLHNRLLITLISQATKTIFVSVFIFLIFYLVVGRHLSSLSEYAKNLNIKQLDKPPPLLPDKKQTGKNELEQLSFSIDKMRGNLKEKVQELYEHRNNLEELVQQRTHEIREAHMALQESEEKFRNLSNVAFEGIALVDNGIIIEVNMTLCSFLGYAVSEITNKAAIDLAIPEERRKLQQKMTENVEEPYETTLLKKDGSVVHVEVQGKMHFYKDSMIHVFAIRDISERKRAEDEIRKLHGIIPICAKCKKIRDDTGYWQQVEAYIENHSEAIFSHSMCQQCADEMYEGEEWYKMGNKSKGEII